LVDLYRLNGVENSNWNDDLLAQLRVIVEFIGEAAQILEKKGVPADLGRRSKGKKLHHSENIYDQIAKLIFEVIFAASAVTSPRDQCWWVQHNAVWGELFNFGHLDGQAGNVVKSRVYRLLYNDIVEMKRLPFPNFKGARILGFCLNVMGLKRNKDVCFKDSRALHKAILIWARKNFAWLYNENPRVGEACLVDGLTYDVTSHRIILTYPAVGLNRQEQYIYLDVDPPPAITEKVET
jgi:hypothetical protein